MTKKQTNSWEDNEKIPITNYGKGKRLCGSYYYNNILKDCTCGKCDNSRALPQMISDLIYAVTDGGQKIEPSRFLSYQSEPVQEYEDILNFISKTISQEKEKWNIALEQKFAGASLGVCEMIDEFIKESDNPLQK